MKLPAEVFIEDLIFLAYRGSIAHNMYIPNSDPNSIDDVDLMGVFVAPNSHYIGLEKSERTIENKLEIGGMLYDCVYYEITHFVNLLVKGNPNVLSMLWLNPEHYIAMSEGMSLLLDFREIFSGRHVYSTFTGYADEQLKKMESYSKKGYMGEKRKRLVEKYGYDTKNAGHLIRLLRMGIEFLSTGKMIVFRPDAFELLEIKTGKWSIEKVKKCAEDMFEEAKVARDSSILPESSNRGLASRLVESIVHRKLLDRVGMKCVPKYTL